MTLITLDERHQQTHTGAVYTDAEGYFYKKTHSLQGVPTNEAEIMLLLQDTGIVPKVEVVTIDNNTYLKMEEYDVILGLDDISKSHSGFATARRIIEEHVDELLSMVAVLNENHIVYGDWMQFAYDYNNDKLVMLDFSMSYRTDEDAFSKKAIEPAMSNFNYLCLFLTYYEIPIYPKLVSKAVALLKNINQVELDDIRHDEPTFFMKVYDSMDILDELQLLCDYKLPSSTYKWVYYSLNARTIHLDGINLPVEVENNYVHLFFTESPLSYKDLHRWELHTLVNDDNFASRDKTITHSDTTEYEMER